MTLEQMKAMLDAECLNEYGEGCYDIENIDFDDEHGLKVVVAGKWEQDHKYQYHEEIVQDNEGNYFCINNTRSGSYHTDWYYGEPSVCQVKRVEKVVTKTVVEWEPV